MGCLHWEALAPSDSAPVPTAGSPFSLAPLWRLPLRSLLGWRMKSLLRAWALGLEAPWLVRLCGELFPGAPAAEQVFSCRCVPDLRSDLLGGSLIISRPEPSRAGASHLGERGFARLPPALRSALFLFLLLPFPLLSCLAPQEGGRACGCHFSSSAKWPRTFL